MTGNVGCPTGVILCDGRHFDEEAERNLRSTEDAEETGRANSLSKPHPSSFNTVFL